MSQEAIKPYTIPGEYIAISTFVIRTKKVITLQVELTVGLNIMAGLAIISLFISNLKNN